MISDIVPLIRFPLMSLSALETVCDQNLVSAEILLEAYRYKAQLELTGKTKFTTRTILPRKFSRQPFSSWDKDHKHPAILINDRIISSTAHCKPVNILVFGNIAVRSKFSFKLLTDASCYESYGIIQLSDYKPEGLLDKWMWLAYPGKHYSVVSEYRKDLIEGRRIPAQSIVSVVYESNKVSVFIDGLKKNVYLNVVGQNLRFVVTLCHSTQIQIQFD